MPATEDTLRFQPIHIDVARNATDDFNPFHDKHRWHRIVANPFPGPIVLGFQLECLIENQMRVYRAQQGENTLIEQEDLGFSNYEFRFVNAVVPGQDVEVLIKESQLKPGENTTLGNRISLNADDELDERVNFPETFHCALLSCALLERAWQQGQA